MLYNDDRARSHATLPGGVNEAVELCVFLRNNIQNKIYNKVIKSVTNYSLYDVQICITTTELYESNPMLFCTVLRLISPNKTQPTIYAPLNGSVHIVLETPLQWTMRGCPKYIQFI